MPVTSQKPVDVTRIDNQVATCVFGKVGQRPTMASTNLASHLSGGVPVHHASQLQAPPAPRMPDMRGNNEMLLGRADTGNDFLDTAQFMQSPDDIFSHFRREHTVPDVPEPLKIENQEHFQTAGNTWVSQCQPGIQGLHLNYTISSPMHPVRLGTQSQSMSDIVEAPGGGIDFLMRAPVTEPFAFAHRGPSVHNDKLPPSQ